MFEDTPGLKPAFLLDNQKTVTRLPDSEANIRHREPNPVREPEFVIADRLMDLLDSWLELRMSPRPYIQHLEALNWQIAAVDFVFSRDIDPDMLLRSKERRGWSEIKEEIQQIPRRTMTFPESTVDEISSWKVCQEARDLFGVLDEMECPKLILSGIYNADFYRMSESLKEQGVWKGLTAPGLFLRSREIASSHLHKAIIHRLHRNIGIPTVAFDDDPNTLKLISDWVGVPGCLVSTPLEADLYSTNAYSPELVRQPLKGPIFQMVIDGDSYVDLAAMAYDWWNEQGDNFLPINRGQREGSGNSFFSVNPNLRLVKTTL